MGKSRRHVTSQWPCECPVAKKRPSFICILFGLFWLKYMATRNQAIVLRHLSRVSCLSIGKKPFVLLLNTPYSIMAVNKLFFCLHVN